MLLAKAVFADHFMSTFSVRSVKIWEAFCLILIFRGE